MQVSSDQGERSLVEMTTVTKSGAIVGTVAYMSPEQLRGRRVDHRSDIFSTGTILFEMLTGHKAFQGETDVDTMTAVLREDPPQRFGTKVASPPDSARWSCIVLKRILKIAFNRPETWASH